MQRSLPPVAILLGVVGLVPFVVCSIGAIGGDPGTNAMMLGALISYGAVILSFVGAVHWGLVLAPTPEADVGIPAGQLRLRLVLGVIPALIGWVATLLPFILPASFALIVLVGGFLLTVLQEARWKRRELLSRGYIYLRWALTIVVIALLTMVFMVRLVGGTVVL